MLGKGGRQSSEERKKILGKNGAGKWDKRNLTTNSDHHKINKVSGT